MRGLDESRGARLRHARNVLLASVLALVTAGCLSGDMDKPANLCGSS